MEIQKSKYNSLREWAKADVKAYRQANSMGLLRKVCKMFGWYIKDKRTSIRTKGLDYWTKERCIEDASKYNTKKEWCKKSSGVYKISAKNKWIDECCVNMIEIRKKKGYWTKERCIEDSKNYSTKKEWKNNNEGAYIRAIKFGWMNECISHMSLGLYKPSGYWTKEKCRENALTYSKKGVWMRKSSRSYAVARENGWIEEFSRHMETIHKPHGYWALERCKEDALIYKTRKEWMKNSNGYAMAQKNGWLEECTLHMKRTSKPNKYWTKERCIEDAQKYTIKFHWKKSRGAYASAEKNGWSEECTAHMEKGKKPNNYWTKERCIEDAQKYSSMSEWTKKNSSAINSARKNGWLDECIKHMQRRHYKIAA